MSDISEKAEVIMEEAAAEARYQASQVEKKAVEKVKSVEQRLLDLERTVADLVHHHNSTTGSSL